MTQRTSLGTRLTLRVCILALALAGVACGGGGNGTPPPAYTGAWLLAMYGNETAGAPASMAILGSLTIAKDGTVEMVAKANRDRLFTPDTIVSASTMTLEADGSLVWNAPTFAGGSEMRGGLDALHQIAVLASTGAGSPPLIAVLVREGTGHSAAALAGDYRVAGGVLGATFDTGFGTYTPTDWSRTNDFRNTNGSIDSRALSVSGTFGVAGHGLLNESTLAPNERTGAVSASRDLVVSGGLLANGQEPVFTLCVRKSVGRSTADFQGEYFMVGFGRDNTTGRCRSYTGTLTADGVGQASFVSTKNDEGSIGVTAFARLDYGVASDGTIGADWIDRDSLGGLSADGRIGILAGGVVGGSDGGLYIFVRK